MGCKECSEHLLTAFNPQSPLSIIRTDTQQICSHTVLSTKHLAMDQQSAFWGIRGDSSSNLS